MHAAQHLESVRRRFTAGADAYSRHAPAQREAAVHLRNLIPDLTPARILEPGCGAGYFTRLLRERWPLARIDAVDAAAGMVARARETLADDDNLRWHVADATAAGEPAVYDLVASNCALHWLLDLPAGFRSLATRLRPGAVFAASLMVRGTLAELHETRLVVAPHKPPRARLPSRELVETALWQAGLTVTQVEEQTVRSSFPGARALLRSLHDQGVTGGWLSQSDRPLTRGELDRLCEIYEAAHPAPEGGVQATYRIAYLVGERL